MMLHYKIKTSLLPGLDQLRPEMNTHKFALQLYENKRLQYFLSTASSITIK